jgi:hypothetical protein
MRTDRRTDRYDEAKNRFSQFCERGKKKENVDISCILYCIAIASTTLSDMLVTSWCYARLIYKAWIYEDTSHDEKITYLTDIRFVKENETIVILICHYISLEHDAETHLNNAQN